MLRQSYGILVALAASACGTIQLDDFGDRPTHKARSVADVQAWNKGPDYAARKKIIYDTVKGAGRDDALAATIQAMAMAETDLLLGSERDTSKDQSGMSRNFSLYNFNLDFLTQIGYDLSKVEALNSDDAVAEATRVALMGVDKFGLESFQNFHRGGSEGLKTGTAYGCVEYRQSISMVQQRILTTPNALSDGFRYGLAIPHV